MRPVLACLILAATLTACASSPSVYAPAGDGDRGYTDTRIEQDRFRVRFEAGADMGFDEAENMALRRAAEITLENDGDWFLVTSHDVDGNDRNPVGVSTGVSISSGSRGYSSRGVGVGLHFDGDAGEKSVSIEILVRSGPLPQDPHAYDARDVLANLTRS
ncbi:CC0125/CC1285 family lipoprotein [Maricaulis sp.]|uniref:CC0125/CC1285 family lipoprotein n=1 Tax=Maricaulis sp. TaxID=1486257 RepID=UPI003A8DF5CD